MSKRAAVIIGVNRPEILTPLNSAAGGAQALAKWLGPGAERVNEFETKWSEYLTNFG